MTDGEKWLRALAEQDNPLGRAIREVLNELDGLRADEAEWHDPFHTRTWTS
ncbi:MAG: hypothetical protein ACRDRY_22275 [Pseudonocardiaceae bacterium]